MKIAIITDIHEDLISLTEALRMIDKYRCDEIVCLGDISGYSIPYYTYLKSRNAHECLALIKSNCKTVVLGNHDMHAGSIIPENSSFFNFPKNWYQLDYRQKQKLANDSIWLHEENDLNPLYSEEDLAYLKSLPEFAILNCTGLKILFSHYIYPNILGIKKEFNTYPEEFKDHFKFMEANECKLSFSGHSHIKGFYTVEKQKFKQYGYKSLKLKSEPVCFGLPPITNQQKRSGFSILDLNNRTLQVKRL
jgi:predicted phosphodiesterase